MNITQVLCPEPTEYDLPYIIGNADGILRSILGKDNHTGIKAFWTYIFESNFDYLLPIDRKGYSLYKAYRTITDPNSKNDDRIFRRVALPFRCEGDMSSKRILIIDDIIIGAHSMCSLKDDLINKYDFAPENIQFAAYHVWTVDAC